MPWQRSLNDHIGIYAFRVGFNSFFNVNSFFNHYFFFNVSLS